jgi:hypothetical protein
MASVNKVQVRTGKSQPLTFFLAGGSTEHSIAVAR